MGYQAEVVVHSLKVARESKQLSQRALSKKVGITQSHISKIENGAVDLQLSNLIELARALDLEVMLIPRKLVSTVQGMVRSTVPTPQEARKANQVKNELNKMQKEVTKLQQAYPRIEEFPRMHNVLKDLQSMSAVKDEFGRVSAIARQLKDLKLGVVELQKTPVIPAVEWPRIPEIEQPQIPEVKLSGIQKVMEQLKEMRNTLAHSTRALESVNSTLHAYSLDKDGDHG